MSLSSPVDSQFFRMLLEEEGAEIRDLLDAEEYLVPQPNFFRPQAETSGPNGPSRHHSHRVSTQLTLSSLNDFFCLFLPFTLFVFGTITYPLLATSPVLLSFPSLLHLSLSSCPFPLPFCLSFP